jgi:hypothetical protein
MPNAKCRCAVILEYFTQSRGTWNLLPRAGRCSYIRPYYPWSAWRSESSPKEAKQKQTNILREEAKDHTKKQTNETETAAAAEQRISAF